MDLAAERKHLGALALFGAHRREPLRSLEDNLRDVGPRLDVIQDRRLAKQTLDRRERRARARLAAVAFNRGHQRRFLAADKRARAKAQLDVEVKAGAEDVLAKKAHLTRLVDRDFQALDGDRILRAHINISLVGTNRITSDRHGLQHGVRVALEHRTVHKRARVALVGVAADIFLAGRLRLGKVPLEPCRETSAAAAAQAGRFENFDHIVRRHLGQHPAERLIAVVGDVFVDILRVDNAAVAQRDTHLFFIKVGLVERFDLILGNRLGVQQAFDDAPLEQVLVDNLLDILRLNAGIKRAFRVDDDDRTERAQAETARLDDLDLLCQTCRGKLALKFLDDFD